MAQPISNTVASSPAAGSWAAPNVSAPAALGGAFADLLAMLQTLPSSPMGALPSGLALPVGGDRLPQGESHLAQTASGLPGQDLVDGFAQLMTLLEQTLTESPSESLQQFTEALRSVGADSESAPFESVLSSLKDLARKYLGSDAESRESFADKLAQLSDDDPIVRLLKPLLLPVEDGLQAYKNLVETDDVVFAPDDQDRSLEQLLAQLNRVASEQQAPIPASTPAPDNPQSQTVAFQNASWPDSDELSANQSTQRRTTSQALQPESLSDRVGSQADIRAKIPLEPQNVGVREPIATQPDLPMQPQRPTEMASIQEVASVAETVRQPVMADPANQQRMLSEPPVLQAPSSAKDSTTLQSGRVLSAIDQETPRAAPAIRVDQRSSSGTVSTDTRVPAQVSVTASSDRRTSTQTNVMALQQSGDEALRRPEIGAAHQAREPSSPESLSSQPSQRADVPRTHETVLASRQIEHGDSGLSSSPVEDKPAVLKATLETSQRPAVDDGVRTSRVEVTTNAQSVESEERAERPDTGNRPTTIGGPDNRTQSGLATTTVPPATVASEDVELQVSAQKIESKVGLGERREPLSQSISQLTENSPAARAAELNRLIQSFASDLRGDSGRMVDGAAVSPPVQPQVQTPSNQTQLQTSNLTSTLSASADASAGQTGADSSGAQDQGRQFGQSQTQAAQVVARSEPGVTAGPPMPSFGHPQWNKALHERTLTMANRGGVQVAEIQLDPPELGSLRVRVQVDRDGVQVSFTSPHAAVRDVIEQQLPRLKEMFNEQGLNLSQGEVADYSSQSGGASDQSQEQSGNGVFASADNDDADHGSLASESVSRSADPIEEGRVDFYA